METFIPPIAPSVGTGREVSTRVLRADFGDGYSQRSGDGLNAINRQVFVVWGVLSVSDADTIEAFLTARAGFEAFLWAPPREVQPRKWICGTWRRDHDHGTYDSLSATFEEVFDLP